MFCSDISAPVYLIFSSEVPHLIYYSHVLSGFFATLVGVFIFWNNRSLLSSLLLGLVSVFDIWLLLNLIVWTNINSQIVMFAWSMFGILNALISVLSLYFVHVYIDRRDIGWKLKGLLLLLLLPLLFLLPTSINLSMFDLTNCESVEGNYYLNYYYGLNFFVFIWIFVYGIYKYFKEKTDFRQQIIVLIIGIEFFLFAFFVSGFLASYLTEFGYSNAFEVEQYGLFGMVIFIFLLGMLVVKYNAFNIKIMGAQAIIAILAILIASQFAFVRNPVNQVLTSITLFFVVVFGYFLVKSVKKEQQQKEELVIMNERLVKLDKVKSDFISIASHQLRTPLTVIKGYLSMILDGSFGDINSNVKESLDKVFMSSNRLIDLVESLLNVSRIESGRLEFDWQNKQLEDLVMSVCDELNLVAIKKGLNFEFIKPETKLPPVRMDEEKLRQVVMNLVDNAIKYTPKGSVTVSLKKRENVLLFCVSDSGLGIKSSDIPNLFKKFSRGTGTSLVHTEGTGIGLYVVRKMIEFHGGCVWAKSAGEYKGSKFCFEIPFVK